MRKLVSGVKSALGVRSLGPSQWWHWVLYHQI